MHSIKNAQHHFDAGRNASTRRGILQVFVDGNLLRQVRRASSVAVVSRLLRFSAARLNYFMKTTL